MESYFMFKNLAIILVAAKICGIAARKCKAPQVVGEIIAGLLIGPKPSGLGGAVRLSGTACRGRRRIADVLGWT